MSTPTQSRRGVLISFADTSLGGTSRSAAMMGEAWRSLGWDVFFAPRQSINSSRSEWFSTIGTVIDQGDIPWTQVNLVHLHHPAGETEGRSILRDLNASLQKSSHPSPPMLTHNVFGSSDRFLKDWEANVATGVLGKWAAWQYHYSMGLAVGRFPWVVPNPQDDARFVLPTDEERREARARLGVDGKRIALRIGSPAMDKWSSSYQPLAETISQGFVGALLCTVGAPEELSQRLRTQPAFCEWKRSAEDSVLRDYYWAADVFALDARRGESFGNVIMESLLSGTPVVYRAHPDRDNTPWEFQDLPGFTYVTDEDSWIGAVIRSLDEPRRLNAAERRVVADRYGVAATARALDRAFAGLVRGTGHRRWCPADSERPDLANRMRIWSTHNLLAASAKELRRSAHHRR